MKSKYYKLARVLSTFIVFFAATGVKPACAGWIYQPRVPKSLVEK